MTRGLRYEIERWFDNVDHHHSIVSTESHFRSLSIADTEHVKHILSYDSYHHTCMIQSSETTMIQTTSNVGDVSIPSFDCCHQYNEYNQYNQYNRSNMSLYPMFIINRIHSINQTSHFLHNRRNTIDSINLLHHFSHSWINTITSTISFHVLLTYEVNELIVWYG